MKERVVIVGGGLGGLFSGAFLAKNGYNVTVLEKNAIIGGGLQCFTRNGKTFETGMHVMGGFEPGGSLFKICNYLGILSQLDIQHVPADCMDELIYAKSGERYRIAAGKEGFIESLSTYFPKEKQNIKAYIEKLWEITEELSLFSLRERDNSIDIHCEEFLWPADELISKYVADPKLREILAYMCPLYGGVEGCTPTYIHAVINRLFIEGASRFKGGSQQLATALKGVIEAYGGIVYNNKKAEKIEVSELRATEVVSTDGSSYPCDWVVFSPHPEVMGRLLPGHTLRPGYLKRIKSAPNSYSAFSVYIDLKPNIFPYIPHTNYYMDDYGFMWNQGDQNMSQTSKAFMFMTPPEPNQGEYAERLLIHSLLSFEEVRKWEATTVGKRGQEYLDWKKQYADGIVAKLVSVYPVLKDAIRNIYTSSPLTIRDFYGVKEGAIFGIRKDCENILFSHFPVRTRIKNLLLTGQNVNLHGICGVPLTAIHTCETLLGTNYLVRKINEANHI